MAAKPVRPSDLLGGIVKQAGTAARRAEVRAALDALLETDVADLVHIRSFRAGKLVLEVESSPLHAELTGFAGESLRQGLNEHLQREKVAQIVFRMGGTGHV